MKNLVTGGAGFIGSNLIKYLLSKGEKVTCIDNLSSGSIININEFFKNDYFEYFEHDVTKPIDLKTDRIWHFASPASPQKYIQNPIETSKVNFIGTYNMLENARKYKARFLLASTSEVYGFSSDHPQSEDNTGSVSTISRRACYQEGKRIAECLCTDYLRQHNLDIRIVRIFNTYGPKLNPNDGRVIGNFINKALKNKTLKVFGRGDQTRAFCYIDDIIDGIFKVMKSNYNKPINLGSDEELSIIDLAMIIKKKINPNLNIEFYPFYSQESMKRRPNIKIANEILNWHPKISLNKGLDITINHFKKNFSLIDGIQNK